jgi:hypothetical protein
MTDFCHIQRVGTARPLFLRCTVDHRLWLSSGEEYELARLIGRAMLLWLPILLPVMPQLAVVAACGDPVTFPRFRNY